MLNVILIVSLIALIFAVYTAVKITRKPEGTDKMKEISGAIKQGAMAFLNKEYLIILGFMIIVGCVLYFLIGKNITLAFVSGAIFSALAGNFGMRIATKANVRTTNAARKNLRGALKIAFSSGAVMGLTVVGFGLLGLTALYYIFGDPKLIYGFGFGASSIALLASCPIKCCELGFPNFSEKYGVIALTTFTSTGVVAALSKYIFFIFVYIFLLFLILINSALYFISYQFIFFICFFSLKLYTVYRTYLHVYQSFLT